MSAAPAAVGPAPGGRPTISRTAAGEAAARALTRFELPAALSASEPPEARGLTRDGVRLLAATPDGVRHARFANLVEFLRPGDLVVVNTSATLPAAVDGRRDRGRATTVHFSTALDDGSWIVELRAPSPVRAAGQPGLVPDAASELRASGPARDAVAGERIALPGGVTVTLLAGHPDGGPVSGRLWRAAVGGDVRRLMNTHGRPIAYDYVPRRWPLSAYQTVFGIHPGSAELPSAGRPFTTELLTKLVAAGVVVAPVTLHTGVSSLEKHEPPLAEPYEVPASTARLVNATRQAGGRVIAVGTTVTRALETVAGEDGTVTPGAGWTELVLSGRRPARVVDGLVTGWHEPGASHLLLLEAVAGAELVGAAYREAVRERYLWHEFGDSCLLTREWR